MNDINLTSLDTIKQFLSGTQAVEFTTIARKERYKWIARTLKRFDYYHLSKKEKGIVLAYMLKMTGYSRQQLTRTVAQYRDHSWIGCKCKKKNVFPKRFTRKDIQLLAETDKYHLTLSGPATKKLFERAYQVYQDPAYERLATISSAHIYNLRQSNFYQQQRRHFTKTQRTKVSIGERCKPCPNGEPGHLRIDTVHQGDQDKVKGVYYINAVDEVTQMEVVCAVEKITENHLIPVLEYLINAFPFVIKGIHSDNGGEYINKTVARLLQKLLIKLTKSRARHSNDNALVESKNGSVIRKHLGYAHIQQKWAPEINIFYQNYFNTYINYHRPCFFPETITDEKGKQKKYYPYRLMMTPYEKFKSLPNAEKYLKPNLTFALLDAAANRTTDLEAAKSVYKASAKLFQKIFKTGFFHPEKTVPTAAEHVKSCA